MSEVRIYGVVVTSLQESKWLRKDFYQVGGNIILASGRPVPRDGQSSKRGEGVALVLAGPAVKVLQRGVSHWKVWDSRLVTATLETGMECLHIMSCYAPTYTAQREKYEVFVYSSKLCQQLHLARYNSVLPSTSFLCLSVSSHQSQLLLASTSSP